MTREMPNVVCLLNITRLKDKMSTDVWENHSYLSLVGGSPSNFSLAIETEEK